MYCRGCWHDTRRRKSLIKPSVNLVREFELKTKLSLLCNRKLKEYARRKININQGSDRLKSVLEAFICEKVMTSTLR